MSSFPSHSWLRGLQRGSVGGGFWDSASWYDANLEKRMPLFPEMMRRMVFALPALADSARVLDFLGGSGAASAAVAEAYPQVAVTVIDSSAERLQRATQRFQRAGLPLPATVHQIVSTDMDCVASGAFSLIVASLALHHLLEHNPACDRAAEFSRWCSLLLRSLSPGVGHLFVCDHTGQLSMFTQMQLMQQAGFVDVEAAWRADDMFVIGARRPSDNEATDAAAGAASPATASSKVTGAASQAQQPASSSVAPPSTFSSAAAPVVPVATASSPAFAVSAPPAASTLAAAAPFASSAASSSAAPPGHVQRTSLMDDDEVTRMIAALQAQNEELKARLNTAPAAAAAAQPSTNAAAPTPTPAPAASSSASPSLPTPAMLSKLPLLFNRFDPSRSGQLTYAALQSLCRAVGRDPDSESDGSESLWWTYQSLALPDPESGQVGLSIEDLSEHFYRSGLWSLEHDLRKLNLYA